MATYLERYEQGEYQQVWQELVALGAAIRTEPLLSDARAVAQTMMTRTRHNIALLIERLQSLKYRFDAKAWERPNRQLLTALDALEGEYGLLPLVLRLWFEVVGQVSFVGSHPKLSYRQSLWDWFTRKRPEIFPIPVTDPMEVRYHGVYADEDQQEPCYFIDLGADQCVKAGAIAEGGPVSIALPQAGFDAPLYSGDSWTANYGDRWEGMFFVPYLRLCFQWGGFPGLAEEPYAAEYYQAELDFLTKDLLPI
jgi:hypothetical protein